MAAQLRERIKTMLAAYPAGRGPGLGNVYAINAQLKIKTDTMANAKKQQQQREQREQQNTKGTIVAVLAIH